MKKITKTNTLASIVAGTSVLVAVIIAAAVLADRPKYDKTKHNAAKQKLEIATRSYDATYRVVAYIADSIVWSDPENRPLVWEITNARRELENCVDDNRYNSIANRYDALMEQYDERVNQKMVSDSGLVAATDEMAAAYMDMEKHERDSAVYAQWRAMPIKHRVRNSLSKILNNMKQK